jgi:hypothetical protein
MEDSNNRHPHKVGVNCQKHNQPYVYMRKEYLDYPIFCQARLAALDN